MQQARPKSPYLGLIIIGGTFIILVLILIVVMGIFFVSRQLSSDQTRPINPFVNANPLNQINVDDIDPALALASLGGLPQSDVILEALAKAKLLDRTQHQYEVIRIFLDLLLQDRDGTAVG